MKTTLLKNRIKKLRKERETWQESLNAKPKSEAIVDLMIATLKREMAHMKINFYADCFREKEIKRLEKDLENKNNL